MRLARLEVVDFRNHPAAALDLEPGANLLLGPNGVGKTNLLEAAGYLAMLGSYRAGSDAALVRTGADAAVIRAAVVRAGGRRLLLELELRPGARLRGRVNRTPLPRARDLAGALRAVVFAPEDLALVRGDPEERRRFLDTLAPQRLPRLLAVRQDYDRILRQRNTLLRSAAGRVPPGGLTTLEVWDERLAAAGGEIWAQRLRLLGALAPLVAAAYQDLTDTPGAVELRYAASTLADTAGGQEPGPPADPGPGVEPAALAGMLRERWARDRSREVERGLTLTGPHRDDVQVWLGGLPARSHASHGEAWSLALSLRLASHRWLSEEGETPVLLLDDVFAELDRRRRERLALAAAGVEQVLVTAAVAEEVPAALRAARFTVRPGEVTRLPAAGAATAAPGP